MLSYQRVLFFDDTATLVIGGGRPGAGTYVRIRGLVAWAALMQSVALSGLLAAKDSERHTSEGGVNHGFFPVVSAAVDPWVEHIGVLNLK